LNAYFSNFRPENALKYPIIAALKIFNSETGNRTPEDNMLR
jgi:hypothetical protein